MNPFLVNGVGSPQSVWQTGTVKHHPIGTKGQLHDGRVFYYSSLDAAATTLLRANLCVATAVVAGHANSAQATSFATLTAGAKNVTVDIGAGAVAAGQYIDGFLNINDVTGEGFDYKIRNHGTAAGSDTLTLNLYDAIVIAGGATSDITLVANPYKNPAIAAANGLIVGVPKVGVVAHATDTTYYWMQTWGLCTVLSGVAITLGGAGAWSATDGSLTAVAAATENAICSALILTVSTEHQMVDLRIRP